MEDHTNARFAEANFDGARFHGVNFSNVRISDAWVFNVDISGLVANLTVNGVDVTTFVEDELNKRHPERLLLAPTDAPGMRAAWQTVEYFSAATLARARALPPALLNQSVDEEWSYLQTLRHLVFATDRWIMGPVLEAETPFHPLGMPNPPYDPRTADFFHLAAQPSLDEVWAVRRERMDRVAEIVATVDDVALARQVPNPNGGMTSVMNCLHVVLREEWCHDHYANRDLAVLAPNE